MANSLEVRCPFLCHVFVDFAATIPSRLKRNEMGGNIILKRVVKDLLPTKILNEPKTGFGLPIAKWFRNDLAPMLQDTLLDKTFARRGLFEQHLPQKMINEHIEDHRDWSSWLWAFHFLELGFGSLLIEYAYTSLDTKYERWWR